MASRYEIKHMLSYWPSQAIAQPSAQPYYHLKLRALYVASRLQAASNAKQG
jgi:hypothetical protein